MAMTPAGFLAVLAGWFVTEIGRQPWIVYGVLRTGDDGCHRWPAEPIALSLAAFVFVYGFVFGAGSYYILRLIGKGPDAREEAYGDHGSKQPPLVTGTVKREGDTDV
jgi:cytochrome d ubiquinol oxidase subunit I